MADTAKPELERIKEESKFLRGTIREELANSDPNFSRDNTQLLKFHGTYQQDDRDVRLKRRKEGKQPLYTLMVRSKIPGGRLTAEQYLAHDDLSEKYANSALRVTTRQGFQFHGVLKKNGKAVIRGINDKLGTTLGACGDVVRNVMACPAPSSDRIKLQVFEHAKAVSDQFLPETSGYHEIWLNGERVKSKKSEENEPIYGKAYLPRKFKIGVAFPEDNCVDVYTHDIGIVPEVKGGELVGFNILVGGGLGMSHGSKETFPRLADPFCFIMPSELLPLTKAIVMVQRDHGGRTSRKHARMKYLIHDKGLAWFQAQVEQRYGKKVEPVHPIKWSGYEDHLGWHEQGDGKSYFGISIENGRVRDEGGIKMKSGIRALVEKFRTSVYLTPAHDLLIGDIEDKEKKEFERILAANGIPLPETLSNTQINSMACPALPLCGLAIAESERVLPAIVDDLESALKEIGLGDERFTMRMTGCPNGCARPYSSEIGLVGRKVGTYNIYLGGSFDGTRLNEEYAENVPQAEVVSRLLPVFELFDKRRVNGERFGDFCHRIGIQKLKEVVT